MQKQINTSGDITLESHDRSVVKEKDEAIEKQKQEIMTLKSDLKILQAEHRDCLHGDNLDRLKSQIQRIKGIT
jgi:hypothetical protein